jgi:diketogulonate reductase-like aldo/keto reductase
MRSVTAPTFLYGTAWKEEGTETYVTAALDAGFRGIDTANQRKHYFEEGVGRGIAARAIPRDDLFIQTKFTFRDGQDHRLPYDADAPIAKQVEQSFASSLQHLGVSRIDSMILHGPSQRDGLGVADREAWRAIEALPVRFIGISNASAKQVFELVEMAKKPIAFVQNRCYADRGWDRGVREVCRANGIVYQAFSLLTANRNALARPAIREIAKRHRKTTSQIAFRFAQQIGMLPLTGTRDPAHMREDLALDFTLETREVAAIEVGP